MNELEFFKIKEISRNHNNKEINNALLLENFTFHCLKKQNKELRNHNSVNFHKIHYNKHKYNLRDSSCKKILLGDSSIEILPNNIIILDTKNYDNASIGFCIKNEKPKNFIKISDSNIKLGINYHLFDNFNNIFFKEIEEKIKNNYFIEDFDLKVISNINKEYFLKIFNFFEIGFEYFYSKDKNYNKYLISKTKNNLELKSFNFENLNNNIEVRLNKEGSKFNLGFYSNNICVYVLSSRYKTTKTINSDKKVWYSNCSFINRLFLTKELISKEIKNLSEINELNELNNYVDFYDKILDCLKNKTELILKENKNKLIRIEKKQDIKLNDFVENMSLIIKNNPLMYSKQLAELYIKNFIEINNDVLYIQTIQKIMQDMNSRFYEKISKNGIKREKIFNKEVKRKIYYYNYIEKVI